MRSTSLLVCAAAAVTLLLGGVLAETSTFKITYSGQGTSSTAIVTGNAVGGGEFDLTGGTLCSATLVTEMLVVSPTSGVFSNSNGDNFVYRH